MSQVRGVRGAIDVTQDDVEIVLAATRQLLQELMAANPLLRTEDLASVIFTVTEDLVSVYPAQAARQIGWSQVPMMCAREIPVPGSLPRCVRVLMHWNTEIPQYQVKHVYLGGAARLRPDLVSGNITKEEQAL